MESNLIGIEPVRDMSESLESNRNDSIYNQLELIRKKFEQPRSGAAVN